MRTIVIRVDARAAGREQAIERAVRLVHERFDEKRSRDARLIRDHHDRQAGAVERADGVDAPRIEGEPLDSREVRDVLDDRAVAIEKHRGLHSILRAASTTAAGRTPRMQR